MIFSSLFLHHGLPKMFVQIKIMLSSLFCAVSVWRGCEKTHLQYVILNVYMPPVAMTDLEMLHVYYLKLP